MKQLSQLFATKGGKVAIHLIFAAVSLGLGFAGWLSIVGLKHQIFKLECRNAESQLLLNNASDVQANAKRLKEKIINLEQAMQAVRAKSPTAPEEMRFLQQLSELAHANKVTFSDFRPGGVVNHPDFKQIELSLRGQGPYAGLCRWLAGLQDLPRMVHVSHLTIVAPSTNNGDCTVDLQLHLVFGLTPERQLAGMVQP